MDSRRLIPWLLLILAMPCGAQTYPYFPPPGGTTWLTSSNTLTLGSIAVPPTVTTPNGSTSAGVILTFTTGAGNGTSMNGGDIKFTTGAGTNTLGNGGKILFKTGANGLGVAVDQVNQIDFNTPFSDLAFGGNDLTWTSHSVSGTQLFFGDLTAGAPSGISNYTLNHEFDVLVNDNGTGFTVANAPTGGIAYGFLGSTLADPVLWTLLASNDTAAVGIDPAQNILTSVKSNAVGDTNGFLYTGSVAGKPTGVPANLTGYYANSVPTRYDTTNNQICYYNSGWQCATAKPVLSGTSASLGGGALAAGACTSGTVAITGAAVGMDAHATPSTYPGDGSEWAAYVSAANTITVKVCAIIALTPTASVYNVRVLQ